VEKHGANGKRYVAVKTDFVESVLERARRDGIAGSN
jgi:hypothetical protein